MLVRGGGGNREGRREQRGEEGTGSAKPSASSAQWTPASGKAWGENTIK